MYTHRFGTGPGAPVAELGAMRIPAGHRRVLDYVDRLGLTGELRPFPGAPGAAPAGHGARRGQCRLDGRAPVAGGGCTVHWGQSPAEAEAQRWRAAEPEGGLFFAGEHTSSAPAWIEGALESAQAAVEALHGDRAFAAAA